MADRKSGVWRASALTLAPEGDALVHGSAVELVEELLGQRQGRRAGRGQRRHHASGLSSEPLVGHDAGHEPERASLGGGQQRAR